MEIKRRKTSNLDKYLILSISLVVIYVIVCVWASFEKVVISDVLTTCVFTLFGSEMFHCAYIKKLKLKGSNDEKSSQTNV